MMQRTPSRLLSLAMMLLVLGTASCERDRGLGQHRGPLGPQPLADVEPTGPTPVSHQQPRQIDPEPVDPTPMPSPTLDAGPGGLALVDAIQTAIGDRGREGAETEIAIRRLRNQSRAPASELREVRARILARLQAASLASSVRFVEEATESTEYTLAGVAYLIERHNTEQWEIYFALRPVDANWRIWKNAQPVRLPRESGSGPDAIDYEPGS